MIFFIDGSTRARVSFVSITIEAVADVSSLCILAAEHFVIRKAMVNLDIKLVVSIPVGPCREPIQAEIIGRADWLVWQRKQMHQVRCSGIDQIAGYAGVGN